MKTMFVIFFLERCDTLKKKIFLVQNSQLMKIKQKSFIILPLLLFASTLPKAALQQPYIAHSPDSNRWPWLKEVPWHNHNIISLNLRAVVILEQNYVQSSLSALPAEQL